MIVAPSKAHIVKSLLIFRIFVIREDLAFSVTPHLGWVVYLDGLSAQILRFCVVGWFMFCVVLLCCSPGLHSLMVIL